MRSGSPAVYLCGKSKDRGMHKWTRSDASAKCVFCGIELTGDDAEDVFRDAMLAERAAHKESR